MRTNDLLTSVPDPGNRYVLGRMLGRGAFAQVVEATDTQASDKKVAIKVQNYNDDNKMFIDEEYEILKELGSCIYVVTFYGIFQRDRHIWFVLENCEKNTALNLVKILMEKNKRMSEEHTAYILKEIVKAIIYLHEHNIVHRDIKASNILLTKEGEVKLCDFGLSKKMQSKESQLCECVGSPCWMAPEVVATSTKNSGKNVYDCRVDVWSLGITAIELAEGKAPLQDMHPSRVLFQVAKNPPPTLEKISSWSEDFHDFISECLVKYYEHRPYIIEVIEHPFLQQIPENNYHLTLEIKSLIEGNRNLEPSERYQETIVLSRYLKSSEDGRFKKIIEEDLADLNCLTEKSILDLLQERFRNGNTYTFAGDILISLSVNGKPTGNYGPEIHRKYLSKSRSENVPHIYALADTAYQNALHHKIPQQIVLTGESASGKTTNFLHLVDHFFYIGSQQPINVFRIKHGIKLLHALIHAGTPTNNYATRCVFKSSIFFGKTGKVTGCSFKVMPLDKWRVSSVDMSQSNFHMLYYIYDGLVHSDAIRKYCLSSDRYYRYLRVSVEDKRRHSPRDNIEQNVVKYKKIFSYMEEFEFTEEQITTFFSVIAAVLNLGEIRFNEDDDGLSIMEDPIYATYVAELLGIDCKKFAWSLTNYCLFKKGQAIRKKISCDESRDARDVLANNLYCRFVDYFVGLINNKLEIGRAIFGSKYTIHILDLPGFECFHQNHFPQFFINTLNEQLQYHFLQRTFAWEMQDAQEENIEDFKTFSFCDNRPTLNELLGKPEGLLSLIDDASKRNLSGRYLIDNLQCQQSKRVNINKAMEFSVAHYTGTVCYNAKEMPNKNRDFLPPEIVQVLRESRNPIIKSMFKCKLDRLGNLIAPSSNSKETLTIGQFCQIKNLRTAGTIFRGVSLQLLKDLSADCGSGSTHFIRCIRSNLKGEVSKFDRELVKHQMRALSVQQTAQIRREGYPYRIPFSEFLRRYQFLAFDFNENVDITQENCRLLLLRLKMEGWAIGKSKVFLKYYNEEYLSRLYESQVRKIVKIQSIMRGFLTKCKMAKEMKVEFIEEIQKRRRSSVMTEEEAAEVIQKAYRRSAHKPKLPDTYKPLTTNEKKLILPFIKKWKSPTLFSVLMRYRAVKMNEFRDFALQVHFYNQKVFFQLHKVKPPLDWSKIDRDAEVKCWLGEVKLAMLKVKFRLDEIPFYDTSGMIDPLTNVKSSITDESWDSLYKWRAKNGQDTLEDNSELITVPYVRNSAANLPLLPNYEEKLRKNEKNTEVQRHSRSVSPRPLNECDSFKGTVQLRKVEITRRYEQNENTFSSTPANQDFNFIRSSNFGSSRSNAADPITELRSITQKRESANDDEPPFNFQSMLRKTNYQKIEREVKQERRESVKEALKFAVRKFSMTKENEGNLSSIQSKPVTMELVPGLVLEGVEVDL